jgi:anthranilate synthase component 1
MKSYTTQKQLLCDTKTPVSLFLALRDSYASPMLLESSDYNSKSNHFSFLCFVPIASISIYQQLLKTSIKDLIEEKALNDSKNDFTKTFNKFINQFEFNKQLSEQ